jgi:hypothetical protein
LLYRRHVKIERKICPSTHTSLTVFDVSDYGIQDILGHTPVLAAMILENIPDGIAYRW